MPALHVLTRAREISIPADVRRRFGIVPGTELVWEEKGGVLVVRPKRYSLDELRAVCAARPVRALSLREIRRARDGAVVAKHGGR